MNNNSESFEDIIFENRNKSYGAYDLRAKYARRGLLALLISMAIFLMAFGIPMISNRMKEKVVIIDLDRPFIGELINPKTEPDVPPPPPKPGAPKPQFNSIKFRAPVFVDEITDTSIIFADPVIYTKSAGTYIDTSNFIIPKDIGVKGDLGEKIMDIIDITEKPVFPGGEAALLKYVAENTHYPQQAITDGSEGTVYVRFVVTKTGRIGEVKVMRAVDPDLEEEALRVVKSLPRWVPGKFNGEPVNVWFIIPVKFRLIR